MKELKVVHIITTLDPGGAENQLLILVNEQIKLGLQVSIIYLKGLGKLKKDFLKVGANVEDKFSTYNFPIQIFKLRKYFKKNEGIVHLHLPQAELTWLFLFRRGTTIISRHSGGQFYSKAPIIISRLLSIVALARCSKCIAISKHVYDYLIESKEIKTQNKLLVVPYGFSTNFYFSNMSGLEEVNLNIPPSKIKLGCIARLSPEKNHLLIFRAVKKLLDEGYDPILFLAGEGNFRNQLEKDIEILQIHENVIFLVRLKM